MMIKGLRKLLKGFVFQEIKGGWAAQHKALEFEGYGDTREDALRDALAAWVLELQDLAYDKHEHLALEVLCVDL